MKLLSRSAVALCIVVVLAMATYAQTPADDAFTRAKALYDSEGPRTALPAFEQALAAYRAGGDRLGEAITLGWMGNCYKHLGNYPRALELLSRALAMKRELHDRLEEGRTLNHLGLLYYEMAEYAKAIEADDQALAIARDIHDRKLEGAALNNRALAYDEFGDYRRSLPDYQLALTIHRETGHEPGQSDALGNIGGVYMSLGRYTEAIRYYKDALAISERLALKESASKDLGNLALCYLGLGQLNDAVAAFDLALVLVKEAGQKVTEADWYKGKGSALLRLGRFDAALENYRRALQTYEAAGQRQKLVEALNDIGYVHLELGDEGQAKRDFRRGVATARRIGFTRGIVANTLALADVHWRSREYAQALSTGESALAGARTLDDSAAIASALLLTSAVLRDRGQFGPALARSNEALERARRDGIPIIEAQALEQSGDLLRRQGKTQEALARLSTAAEIAAPIGDASLLWRVAYDQAQALESAGKSEDAIAAYRRAIDAIQGVRDQIQERRFRTGYIEDKQQVYVALVRLLVRLGRTDAAFEYSEKLRERSYLDLLNRGGEGSSDAGTAELRARIRQLQEVIEKQNSKPAAQRRAESVRTLSEELIAAQREYEARLDDQRASAASRQSVTVPLEQIRHAIPADAAVIEYVLADDELATIVITHDQVHGTLTKLRSVDVQSKVELLRDLIAPTRDTQWQKPAASLRNVLLAPIERQGWLKGITRLYIVPHAFLHYVPFAALPRMRSGQLRYTVEDYEIAYLPAASLLVTGSARQPHSDRLLALAPERSGLRFAAPEARNVAAVFTPNGQALVGRRATETAFKQLGGNYDFLHFATHAYFNKSNPMFSGLQLEADAQNDGRLEVHEILSLRLNARLVALSACDTALGSGYFNEIPAGDEFVGLTRAFLEAGSANVLATLWQVHDESTLWLMRRLYKNVAADGAMDALARAQRTMLHDRRYSHPYYWGAFVLVGSELRSLQPVAEKR